MNVLLIDIGNTRIKCRLIDTVDESRFEQGDDDFGAPLALVQIDQLSKHWRPHADRPVDRALISNVAKPDAGAIVAAVLRAGWPAIDVAFVESSSQRGGVLNGYANPGQLGADRWMAMIGAHALVPDQSLLVCGFGTATTIDFLSRLDDSSGRVTFVGGMILPGLDAMRRALIDATSRLPDRPGRFVDFPNNTHDAIASGILAAQLGAVERAWREGQIRAVMPLQCLVAGGSAAMIEPHLVRAGIPARSVADLVLRGLAVLAREGG